MPRSRSHEANPAQPEGGVAEDTPSTLTTGTEAMVIRNDFIVLRVAGCWQAFITGLTAQTAFNDQPCIVGDFDSRTWRWSVRLQLRVTTQGWINLESAGGQPHSRATEIEARGLEFESMHLT
eukprot:662005-Amphidinium_carterae.1